ncbi:MAG: DUF167 domain-containing protein [Actinomycetota bacterium]|jgi:uncharacterized protein (TIGR00251 family)|nr:DUF167 domain-containing protein [Actinomycetota bacterium]
MKKENIKLLVRPGASKTEIIGIFDGMVKIKVSSQPEKGKANKKLIEFLALKLQIPKKNIRIISGEFSNIKTIEINSFTQNSFLKILESGK